jgi:hypothetical protein
MAKYLIDETVSSQAASMVLHRTAIPLRSSGRGKLRR